ncbi:MAG TPA: hypothetical protein PKH07_18930, partial [bacterium]|nr:hypothetical protein [bacterium]
MWASFWEESNSRPLVAIVRPKDGVEPSPAPATYEMTRGDLDLVLDKIVQWASTREFLADAIPCFCVSFAADHFAALLGGDFKWHPDSAETFWPVPIIEDWSEVNIQFRRDNPWWQRTVETIRRCRQRLDGRMIVSGCHLQGGLDCLAALRGVNRLLLDLLDHPEEVAKALQQIDDALEQVRDALDDEFGVKTFGSMTRHGLYSPGSSDVPQCDFSAMLSPDMFQQFGLPSLKRQCEQLDHSTYHLDGQEAIKHLEAVCSIEKLGVIQWQPGAGAAQTKDWSFLRERIDSLGKGQILGGSHETIKHLWQTFRSRRLFFGARAESRDDAERFLEELERLEKPAGR